MRMLFVALLVGAIFVSAPAYGQQPVCGTRADLAKQLTGKYQENPVGRGVNVRGHMIELFLSPTGTFTIMVSQANGYACLVIAGDGWRDIVPLRGTAL